MKVISFCFEIIFFAKNQNNLAFHPGPLQPPGGEGSPLKLILAGTARLWTIIEKSARIGEKKLL